jgi:hypothetical protein
MAKEQYNVSLKDKQENCLILFTTLLIIASTVYSLYISQHADFFVMNMFNISEFINTTAGKKFYGLILLLSAIKLLLMLGMLYTKDVIKKVMYPFTLLMLTSITGVFAFGTSCPEMINNNVYYCPQTLLVDNKINMVMIGLLAIITFINYRKVQIMEKQQLKLETV